MCKEWVDLIKSTQYGQCKLMTDYRYVQVTSSSVSIVVCQNRVAQLSGTSDIG